MKTSLLKILYIVIVTILFTLGFYRNQWQAVDMSEVQYRRDVSEIFVLGRLVKSHQDGIFSAGGLLGIGDVSESSLESRVIKNQYNKYSSGIGFSQYWVYKSHPGFQGIVFSAFDSLTNFTPLINLSIFRMGVSLLLSITLAMFCLWVGMEIGWFASVLVVLFILASKWFSIFGGNIYWSLWSFYLPLTTFSFLIKRSEADHSAPPKRLILVAFMLSLVKILFSGFEFITSSLLIITVPFVYYAVLNNWGWKEFARQMTSLGISLISSTMVGLVILGIQIKSVLGSYAEALKYIIFAWSKRTYGYENLMGSPSGITESFVEKILDVIGNYLNGHAFSLSTHLRINSSLIRDLADGRYLFLILLFMCATITFFIRHSPSRKTETYQTGIALVVATWFSILGPISWFVVFRDHAALHTRLDFIVWQMPFTLYGFALIGFVASNLKNSRQRGKDNS